MQPVPHSRVYGARMFTVSGMTCTKLHSFESLGERRINWKDPRDHTGSSGVLNESTHSQNVPGGQRTGTGCRIVNRFSFSFGGTKSSST